MVLVMVCRMWDQILCRALGFHHEFNWETWTGETWNDTAK
jgi:hypothetical protein